MLICQYAAFAQVEKARTTLPQKLLVGKLAGGAVLWVVKQDGRWGIAVENAGAASVKQFKPVSLEYYQDSTATEVGAWAYNTVKKASRGIMAKTVIHLHGIAFSVEDNWWIQNNVAMIRRRLTVNNDGIGGFLSGISLLTDAERKDTKFFAPGVIYGSADHLPAAAIGGSKASDTIRIREDRLPAPLFCIYFKDSSSIALLDPDPNGETSREDSHDQEARTLIDARFRFGAIGAGEEQGKIAAGFWWPGSEGGTTYKGRVYPGGQLRQWRRRYHPVRKGFIQQYTLAWRFSKKESFPACYSHAWRWAWQTLHPAVNYQPIGQVQRSLIDMLADRIETKDGYTGITNWTPAAANEKPVTDRKAIMGFTGKNIEAAEFLLADAAEEKTTGWQVRRGKALDIIHSFLQIKLNPPVGEGYSLDNGQPALAIPQDRRVYLRSFGDDLKALLRAWLQERSMGVEHTDWLTWALSFADWLLGQQLKNGGFPRAWEPVTGRIADSSAQSSYTVIPFLVLMSQLTGDARYSIAAVRAGEYCWQTGQAEGIFVGGTIDNPDVADKEAGTLSLEAYLALLKSTGSPVWKRRAQSAADYAETWIYAWNIPMPEDEEDGNIGWKKGVPTTGLQLISSGHSLVDEYMAYDVDEYAQLYLLTKDRHYLDVARLLLHNTKSMMALPGRLYDLRGAGWMQEHWSLAPVRGYGIHRGWLPWVSTSQLNGILGLKALNRKLYDMLANRPSLKRTKAGKQN